MDITPEGNNKRCYLCSQCSCGSIKSPMQYKIIFRYMYPILPILLNSLQALRFHHWKYLPLSAPPHLTSPPQKKVAFGRFLLTGKINFSRNIFVASFLAPKFLKPFQKNCKTISWDSIISVNNNKISLHPVIVINNYIIILSVAKETHLTIFRICLVEFIFIMLFAFFFSFRFRFMVCNHEIEAAKRSIKMH